MTLILSIQCLCTRCPANRPVGMYCQSKLCFIITSWKIWMLSLETFCESTSMTSLCRSQSGQYILQARVSRFVCEMCSLKCHARFRHAMAIGMWFYSYDCVNMESFYMVFTHRIFTVSLDCNRIELQRMTADILLLIISDLCCHRDVKIVTISSGDNWVDCCKSLSHNAHVVLTWIYLDWCLSYEVIDSKNF